MSRKFEFSYQIDLDEGDLASSVQYLCNTLHENNLLQYPVGLDPQGGSDGIRLTTSIDVFEQNQLSILLTDTLPDSSIEYASLNNDRLITISRRLTAQLNLYSGVSCRFAEMPLAAPASTARPADEACSVSFFDHNRQSRLGIKELEEFFGNRAEEVESILKTPFSLPVEVHLGARPNTRREHRVVSSIQNGILVLDMREGEFADAGDLPASLTTEFAMPEGSVEQMLLLLELISEDRSYAATLARRQRQLLPKFNEARQRKLAEHITACTNTAMRRLFAS